MTSLRQQDMGLVCDCRSSLNCFLSSCHHPVKINVSGMKSRAFLSDPSTPAAHKGGWAHPMCSWYLRQSTGAWQVRQKRQVMAHWGSEGEEVKLSLHFSRHFWEQRWASVRDSSLSRNTLFFLPCRLEGGHLALSCHVLNPLCQAALNPKRQSWATGEPTSLILLHTQTLSPATGAHSALQQLQWPVMLLKLCMYWALEGSSGFLLSRQ